MRMINFSFTLGFLSGLIFKLRLVDHSENYRLNCLRSTVMASMNLALALASLIDSARARKNSMQRDSGSDPGSDHSDPGSDPGRVSILIPRRLAVFVQTMLAAGPTQRVNAWRKACTKAGSTLASGAVPTFSMPF